MINKIRAILFLWRFTHYYPDVRIGIRFDGRGYGGWIGRNRTPHIYATEGYESPMSFKQVREWLCEKVRDI